MRKLEDLGPAFMRLSIIDGYTGGVSRVCTNQAEKGTGLGGYAHGGKEGIIFIMICTGYSRPVEHRSEGTITKSG